ncbi:hypothetical protein QYY69_17320, partial [Xanthomonas campestris pv. campestris]|uniref:hypothetical protein n=1 Tax=Xanthomonas campestris TaxID=339 RepID=UPI002AD431FA
DKIGLHPVAVIFAVMAGGQLFGFLGIGRASSRASALLRGMSSGLMPSTAGLSHARTRVGATTQTAGDITLV